ncbi:cytochrome C [Paracoccus sp. TK19116]|uniref:Cytochrome C n=1 Tax=Paracoccus albicereus TaxID=2922394 RepID=A0ABT1MWD3_9RHOB|nr:cytochrome C [Paracoccus albicereus]MCQ0971161.1 cytochrome C [Paracoccus albicereus]
MKLTMIALAGVAFAAPAFAQDASVGEQEFRKCKACHMIQDDAGTDIVKGGKTGPNLYGVVGRAAGSQEGFNYSDALIALGEAGEVWTEEDLAAYITDPNAFVQEKTGDDSLKTKMTFKMRKNQADVVAFLAANSPDAAAGGDAAADGAEAEAPASN